MIPAEFLQPTYYFDFENKNFQKLIIPFKNLKASKVEQAIALYKYVRENWRYDPYVISFNKVDLKASSLIKKKTGHCIDKSVLLVSFLRALEIPASIQLAKVSNHIAVEKLTERFGTNVMTPHGMVNVHLNGKWLKISPAFNEGLCKRYNVAVLEFDGERDSIFQEFNREGHRFMEYLEDYGSFADLPVDFIQKNMLEHYPKMNEEMGKDGVWYL